MMMIRPAPKLDLDLVPRRIAFVVTIAVLVGAIELATTQLGRSAVGEAARTVPHTVLMSLGAATLVSAVAALLGRYLFLLPLLEARRALARREQHYRLIANDAADLILLIAPGGRAQVLSGDIQALIGRHGEAGAAGHPLWFVHRADRHIARAQFHRLSADAPRTRFVVRLKHASETELLAEIVLHRLDGGAETDTLVTVCDVSERYREAEELRAATQAARQAQVEADRANAAKTDFLACMSHEIRTPLNSVIGFAGLLHDKGTTAAQVRLYAERIQASGNALLTVVDDILDFSAVEAGTIDLKPAPFALPVLIDECVSIVQQSAVAKHLSLQVNLHERLKPGVVGDAARIRQILLNLLNNAIKFTAEGSIVLEIRLDRASGLPDRMTFSVIDTGIGIAREDLTRLFHRFQQVDSSIRRTYGGTGLGLAICKKLVELMGGEISVESEKGVGSTFAFTIPLPATPLADDDSLVAAPRSFAARQILLVEDVPINQELVRHLLEARGHTVDIVGNGAEAIMAVQDMDYDIVLMDLQMPYVDGLTATRLIRELPHRCRQVPIVAMTANVLPEQTRLARAAGMVDVIHKPFSSAQIDAALERVFAGAASVPRDDAPTPNETPGASVARLVGLIGEQKVRSLLGRLADSLAARFDEDASTPDGRDALRRQAHASIAGAGMLGFVEFAATCRAFETDTDDASFPDRSARLRDQAADVVARARALSLGSLTPAAA